MPMPLKQGRIIKLFVPESYKHLGSHVTIDANLVPEAVHRVGAANGAYAPIAFNILGNATLSLKYRLKLAWSLVMSTLLYNVHVWSRFDGRARSMLNTMYNRVWRRVYGKPRYGRSDISDVNVRIELSIPSLDCYMRERRLKYLSRMCKLDLPPLMALLQTQGSHQQQMPWSRLVISDLSVLYIALPRILSSLPPPEAGADPFWQLARDFPCQWHEIVNEYFTVHDDAMQPRLAEVAQQAHACNHVCDICDRISFRTQKALNQHKRIAHKCTSRVCDMVQDTSVCPVCHTDFIQRSRHLSDTCIRSRKRGTCCHDEFVKSVPPPLSAVEKTRLRQQSATDLRAAKRQGHTHVIATRPSISHKMNASVAVAQLDAQPLPKRRRLRFKQPEVVTYR